VGKSNGHRSPRKDSSLHERSARGSSRTRTAPLKCFLSEEARARGISFEAPRAGDAGYDIRAAATYVVEPGSQIMVATGLFIAIPDGWVGLIKDRSSMASRRYYTHGGVIDSSYRGEVRVLLSNQSAEPFEILPNDRIAQLVVVPHFRELTSVEGIANLGETARQGAGFGSSGR